MYCEAVGALNWAAVATQLDIAPVVAATVAHTWVNAGLAHWKSEEGEQRGMGKFDSKGHHDLTRCSTTGTTHEDQRALSQAAASPPGRVAPLNQVSVAYVDVPCRWSSRP